MAKANNSMIMFINLILLLSLLLTISMTEGRLSGFGSQKVSSVVCDLANGVQTGDTCSSMAKKTNLTAVDFSSMNPNLDCNKLFVGQWLCVSGAA